MKLLPGFASFQWSFFIDDTPELALGVLLILLIALVLDAAFLVVLLPLAVVALLAASTLRRKVE